MQGRIGQLGVLRLKRVAYVPTSPVDNWYIDENRSGGPVVDLMIHDFDYARWIGGEVDRSSRDEVGPPPALRSTFKPSFISRVAAWPSLKGVGPTPRGIQNGAGCFGNRWSDGVEFRSTAPDSNLLPTRSHGSVDGVGLPVAELSEDPYTSEIRHAYEVISTGAKFEVTAEDALEALRIALAARDSFSAGGAVSFEKPF